MKSLLDVFNKVSEHLLAQNEQALDANEECVYRSETGLKCAVGCLIKDEFYFESLEYSSLSKTGAIAKALKRSGVVLTREMLDLLIRLQKLHDRTEPEEWKEALGKLKLRFFRGAEYEHNFRRI